LGSDRTGQQADQSQGNNPTHLPSFSGSSQLPAGSETNIPTRDLRWQGEDQVEVADRQQIRWLTSIRQAAPSRATKSRFHDNSAWA
jgi:hypothetical protein